MIKNFSALLAALTAAVGCQEEPKYPGALQGIVELDERVAALGVTGRLMSLTVDEGSVVEADAVLGAVDDVLQQKVYETRVFEAEAARAQLELLEVGPRGEQIRAMRARLDAAKANEKQLAKLLERHRGLAGSVGATPASVVDEVEARYLSAVAERRAIEQELRALREGSRSQELAAASARASAATAAAELEAERLERHKLRAPFAGTVTAVHVERGEIVLPGAPILTIADPLHPFADVFVPQPDIAGIAVGTAAEVHTDSLESPLAGRVEFIESRTEFTPRFVFSEAERPNLVIRVRVRIDDPGRSLHAGLPAFVYFKRTRPDVASPGGSAQQ